MEHGNGCGATPQRIMPSRFVEFVMPLNPQPSPIEKPGTNRAFLLGLGRRNESSTKENRHDAIHRDFTFGKRTIG